MWSKTGKQIITIQYMSNISRSKDKQTMKFGQLIKYNMRYFFPEKSYAKCAGEAIPYPFF